MRNEEPKLRRTVRAAVYARYSSEMQSSSSARDQVDRIVRLAENDQVPTRLFEGARITVLPEWVQKDEAITGKVAGRIGYQKILEGVRSRAFDMLLVDDLSRLTRSLGNLLELYQLLRHYDVELVSISDRLSSADPNSRTFFTVKGMVADFGNEAHAERTRRGIEARARGEFSTGPRPFGYESVATQKERRKNREVPSHFKVVVNEEQAKVVRRIFALYAEGFGRTHIAKTLNGEGVPSADGARSRGWKVGPLEALLRNEKYIGHWVYNKTYSSYNPDTGKRVQKLRPLGDWIVAHREDLRIVPQDIWDRVHARLEENRAQRETGKNREQKIFGARNRVDNQALLTGSLVCAGCGGACALISGRNGGYYGCIEAHRHGTCQEKFLLRRDFAEKAVTDYVDEQIVSSPAAIQFVTDRYNEAVRKLMQRGPARKREIEGQLDRLSKEIANLVKFITEGNSSDIQAVSSALREREAKRGRLEQELRTVAASENSGLFVTTFVVRDRLAKIVKEIKEVKGAGVLRRILEEPLVVKKSEGVLELTGRINLGTGKEAFASVQKCALSNALREPYLIPISREIRILIKTKS